MNAVDFACYTIRPIPREMQAFGEVEQSIHALSVAVKHDEHGAGRVFRPREQKPMIGAEVEQDGQDRTGESVELPPASAAPLWS